MTFRVSLEKQVGMNKSHWRKSATWFALNRKHAQLFVDEIDFEKGWESVPCCDEHYLPSILAYHKLDNETTCTDGFAHVYWESLVASHPHTYGPEEITEKLFNEKFRKPVGTGQGFSQLCSGNPNLCHFTARKFSGDSKFALLENLHFILNDNRTNLFYEGNPWVYFNDKLRVLNETQYFLIENGGLREFPDVHTLRLMHFNESYAKPLTDEERKEYPTSAKFPSRKDGLVLKAPKRNYIFVIEGGKRRGIPNMETLHAMGLGLWNVTLVSESDLSFIPMGDPIPDKKYS